jgi:hypothetical protein
LKEAAMNKSALSLKYYQILVIAFCLLFAGVSCTAPVTATAVTATPATPAATAVIPTVKAPQAAESPTVIPPTPTPLPTADLEAMPGLAGIWLDPQLDGSKTISTIEWQNGTYVVTSVVNTTRGKNELKTFSWANGVLTWDYCPAIMQHCIIQNTVSLKGNSLSVKWTWAGGGNSGTSDLQRQP